MWTIDELLKLVKQGSVSNDNVDLFLSELEKQNFSKEYYEIVLILEEQNLISKEYAKDLKNAMAKERPNEVLAVEQANGIPIEQSIVNNIYPSVVEEYKDSHDDVVRDIPKSIETSEKIVAPEEKIIVAEEKIEKPEVIIEKQPVIEEKGTVVETMEPSEEVVEEQKQVEEKLVEEQKQVIEELVVGDKVDFAVDNSGTYVAVVNDDSLNKVGQVESLGIDVKQQLGTNVYELDENKIKANGFDSYAIDANQIEELNQIDPTKLGKDIMPAEIVEGLDIDAYNNVKTDLSFSRIAEFIKATKGGVVGEAVIQINNSENDQRTVTMSVGGNTVYVNYPNGDEFDKYVLPQIVDLYIEENNPDMKTINNDTNSLGGRYEISSNNETKLIMNNPTPYAVNVVNTKVLEHQEEVKENSQDENSEQKEKPRVKTLGEYYENKSNNNAAFTTPVLLVIIALIMLLTGIVLMLLR